MTIHYSAEFEALKMSYHGEFDVIATGEQITQQTDRAVSIAVGKLKSKCEAWNVNFETMNKFQVYYFNRETKQEVLIFKKEKTK
jgi:hypothetical protein